jgi:2-iminoacetate synthase ThiH
MTRDELVELLRGRDALTAAGGLPADAVVTWSLTPPADEWDLDADGEHPIDEHRAAHRAGRPTVAAVAYGEGVDPVRLADRLLALRDLARETGMLRAVRPVPAPGVETPGSWGVEDLTVVAAARRVLDPDVRVRPSWERLGAPTCGVALAFGADDLVAPDADPGEVEHLVAAAGRRGVAR